MPKSGVIPHLTLFSLCFLVISAHAAITINVPGDVPTITQAVALASNGDTILVSGGPYSESVTVSGLQLTIEPASPEPIVWNAAGGQWCLRSENGADVTTRRFVFQQSNSVGVGAYLGGTMTVENCTLQNNLRNGASTTSGGTLTIRNCLLQNNTPGSTLSHGGVRLDNSGTTGVFENCTIIGDKIGVLAYGIMTLDGAHSTIRNCVFIGAARAINAGNSGSLVISSGNVFSGNTSCHWLDRNASINAGDLGNISPDDDGGNVIFADNVDFLNNSGGTLIGEGNLYSRIDSAYLDPRVSTGVDYSPAFQVVVERAATHPDSVRFPTPVPDGQFLEIRAVANEPGAFPINIGNWLLSDDPLFTGGDEGVYEIPDGTSINTGESILLAWNLAEIDRVWGLQPAAQTFDLSSASPEIALAISGDEVFLTPNPVGIHDALLYGATDDTVDPTIWLAGREPLGSEGTLFTRDLDSTDTNTAADWTSEYFGGRLNTTPIADWEVYR